MANSCPRRFQCGTIVPGWLKGELPSVQEGVVSRRVCFHQSRNCCYESTEAKVRNCGVFYVYYLNPTPYCQLRYCGNGKSVRKKYLCKKRTIYRVLVFTLHNYRLFCYHVPRHLIVSCMYVIVLQVHQPK